MTIASSKNKSQNVAYFLDTKITTIISPRFTSNSPQLHHEKPHTIRPVFPKPPAKSPLHHGKKNAARQLPNRTVFNPRLSAPIRGRCSLTHQRE
jgi:hypothetical protein